MLQQNAVGSAVENLDTPVLLVDLPTLESNIERMARTIVHEAGVHWRPHMKGIKTPAIGHMMLRAGAIGVTCAKLGEAEVMAANGISDILVANQVVGARKIARLVNVQHQADVAVAVDDVANVEQIAAAARDKGVCVRLLVEVNAGMNRAGVEPGAPAVELARHIAGCKGVKFSGLTAWEMLALKVTDTEGKRRVVAESLAPVMETAETCRAQGLPVDIISTGGTGTYWVSAFHPGVTEVQAGGGVFSDIVYRRHYGLDLPPALTVLSTVTSRPTATRIICDAGRKTMSSDSATPEAIGLGAVASASFSAEHGKLELEAPSASPAAAETIRFVPGSVDSTVVLHDALYGVRDGIVEAVWPLLARGRLL